MRRVLEEAAVLPKKKERKPITRHTQKWYKENWGCDPLKLGLPYETVTNPHFRSAYPMKLWEEADVLPHKSSEGVMLFKKRSEETKLRFQKRRERLKNLFQSIVSSNPDVQAILKRLYAIHIKIGDLHNAKAEHREFEDSGSFFEYGIQHCDQCAEWTMTQNVLRQERKFLFVKLEELSHMDKQTIQLARKYLREDAQRDEDEQEQATGPLDSYLTSGEKI